MIITINDLLNVLSEKQKNRIKNTNKEFLFVELIQVGLIVHTKIIFTNDNRGKFIDKFTKNSEDYKMFYIQDIKDLL